VPALDDVSQIASMQKCAEDFKFYAPPSSNSCQFPMSPPTDLILDVAILLRASLYFFDLRSIVFSDDRAVAIVKGFICCRLDADSDALRTLLAQTVGFRVKSRMTTLEGNVQRRPFRLAVSLQQELSHETRPLSIEAHFTGVVLLLLVDFHARSRLV